MILRMLDLAAARGTYSSQISTVPLSYRGVMSNRKGQWYQDGEWWVRHDRTTKSFARLRMEAVKALQWGLPSLFSKPKWKDSNTLHITSGFGPAFFDIAEGYVVMEEGQITCKLRFLKWPFMSFFLQDKTLSDIGTMAVEVAGTPFDSKEVFIVHGHSDTAKSQLRSLLSSLGLQPVILSEQTHRGRTIIEELEHHSTTCSFAFVLMTPDDIAGSSEAKSLRARQNVILELGWFMARLGRENVILMSQGEIELPSDILGVLYLPFKKDVLEVADQITKQLRDVGLL